MAGPRWPRLRVSLAAAALSADLSRVIQQLAAG